MWSGSAGSVPSLVLPCLLRSHSPHLSAPILHGLYVQPWGLKISVYLPRQSLRYLLDLTVRQVAAVIEDARLEQWEKDMLDHDKVFKVSVCASARWCGEFAVAVVSSRYAFVPTPASVVLSRLAFDAGVPDRA